MDVLTIIPREKHLITGIPRVWSCIVETGDEEHCDHFWNNYFKRFGMSSDKFIACRNISDGETRVMVYNIEQTTLWNDITVV